MATGRLSYRAGAAAVCITPDESLWLAGYAARTAPARGKISDLYASALALEDEAGGRLVIASADLIAITPIIAEPVIEAARQRHGLKRSQLLLTATHTHYGPEFRPDKAVFFDIPADFADRLPTVASRLAAAITEAIDAAISRLQPAQLVARKTSAGFAHNRRRHGVVVGGASTDDIVDHDVPVLECINAAGRRLAIVFGYACHNTTIPPDDRRYCGDWAGFAKEQLELENPGATAIFLPGAGADQDTEPAGSVELARAHGAELANAVQQSLDEPGREIGVRLVVAKTEISLELEPFDRSALERTLGGDDEPRQRKARFLLDQLARGERLISSYPAPIQAVRLGDELIIAALCGEPVVDWSHAIKRELAPLTVRGQSPLIWVAGYANDMFGYLPTRRVQAEGGYEGGRANLWSWIPAPFTSDAEDRVMDAVRRLVAQVCVLG